MMSRQDARHCRVGDLECLRLNIWGNSAAPNDQTALKSFDFLTVDVSASGNAFFRALSGSRMVTRSLPASP